MPPPAAPSLRIAQVAPLYESVPPKLYGGTERVVAYLTDQLVADGHDVTLFASGDSETRARLVPICPQGLRLDPGSTDAFAHHVLLLERVFQDIASFDVVHFHCDYIHFPLSRRAPVATLTTLHGRLDIPDLLPLYDEFADMPLVSISDAQRRPLSGANWRATVYHGLPRDFAAYAPESGEHLAFLGRVSPEKGIVEAVEIARRAGMRLQVAAKVDEADREFYETTVRPILDDPLVEFLGEIGDAEKPAFLGSARALLFPIDWPEPFGLVMIEALASGTPVIAFPRGSVPEIIEDGVTGFLVEGIDAAARAAVRASQLRREDCRRAFEERFTAERMARDYVAVYRDLIARPTSLQGSCEPALTT